MRAETWAVMSTLVLGSTCPGAATLRTRSPFTAGSRRPASWTGPAELDLHLLELLVRRKGPSDTTPRTQKRRCRAAISTRACSTRSGPASFPKKTRTIFGQSRDDFSPAPEPFRVRMPGWMRFRGLAGQSGVLFASIEPRAGDAHGWAICHPQADTGAACRRCRSTNSEWDRCWTAPSRRRGLTVLAAGEPITPETLERLAQVRGGFVRSAGGPRPIPHPPRHRTPTAPAQPAGIPAISPANPTRGDGTARRRRAVPGKPSQTRCACGGRSATGGRTGAELWRVAGTAAAIAPGPESVPWRRLADNVERAAGARTGERARAWSS